MHNLTAQVTSSLLPFPRVTVDALREDEITLDLVLHGRFTVGKFVIYWSQISRILVFFFYLIKRLKMYIIIPLSSNKGPNIQTGSREVHNDH